MRVGIFVENVLLRVNGGILTDESADQRVDIRAYLPAAVNYALAATHNINLKTYGDRDFPSQFYLTFSDLPIVRTTNPATVTLPKGYAPLSANAGIRFIRDDCNNTYTPLSDADRHVINHYVDILTDINFFYPINKKTLHIWSSNPLAEKIHADLLVDINELEDEDELPLQADVEQIALEMCYAYFTGQRQTPADTLNNKQDINAA